MNRTHDPLRDGRDAAARRLLAARRTRRHADALIALAALPGSRAARCIAVESALRHGDPRMAEALVAQAILRSPDDPRYRRLRAKCRMRRGEFAAAALDLMHALSLEPLRWGTHLALAQAERRGGRLSAAEKHLVHARALAGEQPSVAWEAARCALARGKAQAALNLLERYPGAPDPLLLRALSGCRRIGEALDVAERIALHNRHAGRRQAATEFLCRHGDPVRLRKILDAIPDDDRRRATERLIIRLSIGDFRGLVTEAFHCRKGPRSGVALSLLAIAALRLDRSGLAERAVRRLRRAHTPPPPTRRTARWLARARFVDRRRRVGGCTRAMVDPSCGLLTPLLRTLTGPKAALPARATR